jgi:hypothetical protein
LLYTKKASSTSCVLHPFAYRVALSVSLLTPAASCWRIKVWSSCVITLNIKSRSWPLILSPVN